MFIYGLYLWGALYDKSSGQIIDPANATPSQAASGAGPITGAGGLPTTAPAPSRSGGYASTAPPIPSGPNPLPVIHVTCWPRSERPLPPPPDGVPIVLASRAAAVAAGMDNFACPVYPSRAAGPRQAVFELELPLGGAATSRWTLRGLQATVRPF